MRKSKRKVALALSLAAASATVPTVVKAAVYDWKNNGTSTAWATTTNWNLGGSPATTVPANDLITDIARFNQTSYAFQPNAGSRAINGIVVGDGTVSTGALTIASTLLSIGSSGFMINANAGTVTLNNSTRLGANQTWQNDSNSLFTVGSTVSNVANVTPFTLTIAGSGSGGMIFNGVISNGGTIGTTSLIVSTTGTGVTTFAGVNTYTGGLNIKSGTVIARTSSSALGAGTVTLGDLTGSASASLLSTITSNLNFSNAIVLATNPTVGGLTVGTGGTAISSTFSGGITGNNNFTIANNSTTGSLTVSGSGVNNAGSITHVGTSTGQTNISGNIGSNVVNVIQNSATTALNLSGATIAYTGGTSVNAGTLNITGSTPAPLATTAVAVAGGATLNTINTVGQTINLGSGPLSLGVGSGTTTLGFELGSTAAYDQITTGGAATTANTIKFNLSAIAGFGAGTYNLLTAVSGLNTGAAYQFSAPVGWTYASSITDTNVALTFSAAPTTLYWSGALDNKWNTINAGANTNFSADLVGTPANATPGANSTVIFSNSNQTGTSISSTLETSFTVNNLVFNNQVGSGPATSVLIGKGAAGALTITPASSSDGIDVQSGAPAGVTISAGVTLGSAQTWNVADSGSTLAFTGGVLGGQAVTKTGAGTARLGTVASNLGNVTINAGTLAILSTGSNTISSIHINSGNLSLDNGGAIAGNGTIYVGDPTPGATTDASILYGQLSQGMSIANNLEFIGTTTGILKIANSGGNTHGATFSGNITLNHDATFSQGGDYDGLNLTGTITTNNYTTTFSGSGGNNVSQILVSGANASTFTGPIIINNTGSKGVELLFNQNSLGSSLTDGSITFLGTNVFLTWRNVNTQDLSGRFAPLTGTTKVSFTTGTNNIVFANPLVGASTAQFAKTAGNAGTLTLNVASTFGGIYTADSTGGATILKNANSLGNATVTILTGVTTGGIVFDSTVASHGFTFGNLAGAGNLALVDNASNTVNLTFGGNNTAATYSGVISGSGTVTKVGTGIDTVSGANTFTGAFSILGGQVRLTDAGKLSAVSSYLVNRSTLNVDNTGTYVGSGRLNAVPLTLQSASYSQSGKGAANSSTTETAGSLVLDSGANLITLIQANAGTTSNILVTSGLARNNHATAFVRGSSALGTLALGSTTSTLFRSTGAVTDPIGGGGSFASGTATNISIIPYFVGDSGATGSVLPTFLGYDTGNGSYRTLKSTEYLTNFTGANSTSNVRLSSASTAVTVSSGSFNSLIVNEATALSGVTTTLNGAVTLNSGALLISKSTGTARDLTVTGGQLQAAAADVAGTSQKELIVSAFTGANVQIDSQISGTGGLTLSTYANGTNSNIILNSASNDYTGTTTVNGTVTVTALSKLGNSAAVYVAPSSVLTIGGNTTIDDSAVLTLTDGGTLNLAFADGSLETVSGLVLGSAVINTPTTFNSANNWGGYGNSAGSFFAGSTGGITVAVPEPTSIGLVGLGLTALLRRRRRAQ